jgi:hypothetical protein
LLHRATRTIERTQTYPPPLPQKRRHSETRTGSHNELSHTGTELEAILTHAMSWFHLPVYIYNIYRVPVPDW